MSFLDLPVINLLFKNKRQIQSISGYITISETTKDELEITQQPVQQGATITDHAFLKPTILQMQIQFDRTNVLAGVLGTVASAVGNRLGGALGGAAGFLVGAGVNALSGDVLAQTYQKLLTLQATREAFDIATPKRIYKSMLFQSLGLVTDKKTENVLSITASFQQIIIVNVTTTTVARTLQKLPGLTGATQAAGKKSAALTGFQGINPNFSGFSQ